MFRKLVCAVAVLAIGFGVAMAEEFRASIKKVDDGKVTFVKAVKKGDTPGEPVTLPVADNVKVVKGSFNKETKKIEAGDAIETGLKNEMFKTIGEKGLGAVIVTDEDGKKITEIRIGGKKKKAAN